MTWADFIATASGNQLDSVASKINCAMVKKSRGKNWGRAGVMSVAETRDLITSGPWTCWFTGSDLIAPVCAGGVHSSNPWLNLTWDRLDPSLGYIVGNVVPCSAAFNKIKSCMTMQQIETALAAVQQYNCARVE